MASSLANDLDLKGWCEACYRAGPMGYDCVCQANWWKGVRYANDLSYVDGSLMAAYFEKEVVLSTEGLTFHLPIQIDFVSLDPIKKVAVWPTNPLKSGLMVDKILSHIEAKTINSLSAIAAILGDIDKEIENRTNFYSYKYPGVKGYCSKCERAGPLGYVCVCKHNWFAPLMIGNEVVDGSIGAAFLGKQTIQSAEGLDVYHATRYGTDQCEAWKSGAMMMTPRNIVRSVWCITR